MIEAFAFAALLAAAWLLWRALDNADARGYARAQAEYQAAAERQRAHRNRRRAQKDGGQ